MILGMSIQTFTQFHVIISLVGIVAGMVVHVWLVERASTAYLDVALSGHDHSNERHGFYVSGD